MPSKPSNGYYLFLSLLHFPATVMHLILFQLFLNNKFLQMYRWPTYRPTLALPCTTFSTYSFFGIYLMLFQTKKVVLNDDIAGIYLKGYMLWIMEGTLKMFLLIFTILMEAKSRILCAVMFIYIFLVTHNFWNLRYTVWCHCPWTIITYTQPVAWCFFL